MAEILRLIAALDLPPYESMSGAEARAAAEERNVFWNEGNPEVARVREVAFPAPPGHAAAALRAGGRRRHLARHALHPWRRLGDLLARHP